MSESIEELILISRRMGCNTALVQGGGGNTSVKTPDGRYMYIKASGTALKDMSLERGWRRLNLERVREIIRMSGLAEMEPVKREKKVTAMLLQACEDEFSATIRPSIESILHAFLARYTIHLHPLPVCAYVSAQDGRRLTEKMFAGMSPPVMWVPYINPGYALARAIAQLTENYQAYYGCRPAAMFLEKHGVFSTGDDLEKVIALIYRIVETCQRHLPQIPRSETPSIEPQTLAEIAGIIQAGFAAVGQEKPAVTCYSDEFSTSLLQRPNAKELVMSGPLSPEEILEMGGAMIWIESLNADTIAQHLQKRILAGYGPANVWVVKDTGFFIAGAKKDIPTIEMLLSAAVYIRHYTAELGGVFPLTDRQEQFIYDLGSG